eukprot:6174200-Pleurochrysis_carterae.AAC.9
MRSYYMGLTTDRSAISVKGAYLPIYVAWKHDMIKGTHLPTYVTWECDIAVLSLATERARTIWLSQRTGRRKPCSTHPPSPLSQGVDLRSRWTRQAGRTEARRLASGPGDCIGPAYPTVREALENGRSRLRRDHTPYRAVGDERRCGFGDLTDPELSPISLIGGSSQSATA